MEAGTIGAGTMGAGIAQAFTRTEGHGVFLCDIGEELAVKEEARITKGFERRTVKGEMTREEVDAVLARIYTGIKDIYGDCDLIVEAATEGMEVKRQTFREPQHVCKKECMFASNTSSLSITKPGAGLNRPVTGTYFLNPAPVMKLAEVIAGLSTPAQAAGAVRKITEPIGKMPVQAEEAADFMVNRLLIPMINEATGIYAEGIADVEGIDSAMKLGTSYPVGPLALGDLVGLSVVLTIMEMLQNEAEDSKYHPHPLLRRMVRGDRLGQRTDTGPYNYREQKINNTGGAGHGFQFVKRASLLADPVPELR